jgi:excinuclease UvrABC nuclease subunit
VLYVGKAQNLRNRVRSYWQKKAPTLGQQVIRAAIDRVEDVEYTITDSVGEALLLEGNLVKRFQPQFNLRPKHRSGPFGPKTSQNVTNVHRTLANASRCA